MGNNKFVNRKTELNFLNQTFKLIGFKSVLIYGRKRVGKTFLIKEFLKGRTGIFFPCSDVSIKENINNFIEIGKNYGLPSFKSNSLHDYFEKIATKVGRHIIIFDEIHYLYEQDSSILKDLLFLYKELEYTDTLIILSSSSNKFFKYVGYDPLSPLFGRFLQRINLKNLNLKDTMQLHDLKPFEEIINIYGAIGGIPYYHQFFSSGDFLTNITNTFFNTKHELNREVDYLLNTIFRNSTQYSKILNAIGHGNLKTIDITSSTKVKRHRVSKYLKDLESLEIISKIIPVEHSSKSKTSKYLIKDSFFHFWFNFVSPLKCQINGEYIKETANILKSKYPVYLNSTVENIVSEILKKSFEVVGKWWNRNTEIDILAINHKQKEIMFCDIDWSNTNGIKENIKSLKEKRNIYHKYPDYKLKYLLICNKDNVDESITDDVMIWNLDKIENLVINN